WQGLGSSGYLVYYQTFLWTPAGLAPPLPPAPISATPAVRISLDCYGLKKAVVVFDEAASAAGGLGQICARVFTMGTSRVPSNPSYVAGSITRGKLPDLSPANHGNTVRIAVTDLPPATPPPYDIVVLHTSW